MSTLAERIATHVGHRYGGSVEKMGYCLHTVLEVGDNYPTEGKTDLTAQGRERLHAAGVGNVVAGMIGCDSEQCADVVEAIVGMKPFVVLEWKLALENGFVGYAMYRALVPQVLMSQFGYVERVALLATMSGHTATASILWLLVGERYKNNLPAIIHYWVNARVNNKDGVLVMKRERFWELMRTWVFKRREMGIMDRVQMAWALWQQHKTAQKCGTVLARVFGELAMLEMTESEFIAEVNGKLAEVYPEE
ncbi:MAG: hypothetical protein WCW27_02685 [Patescibacteria group bacterium]